MVSGKIFKNIFQKVLAKIKKLLYTYAMNKISLTSLKACLTGEYRTPFIGSDNQSWAHVGGSGTK
jgi:hypothetical protein